MLGSGFGDANLNKSVTFADFVSLANNFGQTGIGWLEANFNLDNVTNFSDFVLLANNFGVDFTSIGAPSSLNNEGTAADLADSESLAGAIRNTGYGNGDLNRTMNDDDGFVILSNNFGTPLVSVAVPLTHASLDSDRFEEMSDVDIANFVRLPNDYGKTNTGATARDFIGDKITDEQEIRILSSGLASCSNLLENPLTRLPAATL